MPAEMNEPKTETELSIGEHFSRLSKIYAGVSGHIYKSNVERHHKAIYGLCYPAALGFGLLALFKGPWHAYALFAALMFSFALIISASNGRNKRDRESSAQLGAK
jgi:hypothetical protein